MKLQLAGVVRTCEHVYLPRATSYSMTVKGRAERGLRIMQLGSHRTALLVVNLAPGPLRTHRLTGSCFELRSPFSVLRTLDSCSCGSCCPCRQLSKDNALHTGFVKAQACTHTEGPGKATRHKKRSQERHELLLNTLHKDPWEILEMNFVEFWLIFSYLRGYFKETFKSII